MSGRTRCDAAEEWANALRFYASSAINMGKVKVLVGGIPWILGTKGDFLWGVMVVDQTIYLDAGVCPEAELLVHELVHVWQFQSGWWFQEGPSKYWAWQLGQIS